MNNISKIKVVIIQPYNTPYRNELFNEINRYEDIELYLVYVETRSENRKWNNELNSDFKEINVRCKTKKVSYEINISKVDIIDFVIKICKIQPDVIISQLSKYTILIKYILFWKKIRLIHWSESTFITADGVNRLIRKYLKWHIKLIKAYLFPGIQSFNYHNYCGYNLNENNVFFAPNSVDEVFSIEHHELLTKFSSVKKMKYLFIGSFISRKGFDNLNEAFEILIEKYANIEFHIAGDGPIKPISNAINHGFLNKEQTTNLFKECHVFIMPSLWDCNPLSVIESAKCGCILLLSDGVGNYPELIDGNGFVFKRGVTDSIISAVESTLHKSAEELITMAEKSIALSSTINHKNTANAFYKAIKFVMR